jgi:hypothetical protein
MPTVRRTPILSVAYAAVLAACLAGCTSVTGPVREMETAQRRWGDHGPADYQVTVTRACECLPAMTGPVRVTVRAGLVTARQYVTTGEAVATEVTELFPSVPELFELVADAHRRGAADVNVTYDPVLGYPVRIAVDYDATMADDEVVYSVRDLQPL